MASAKNMHVTVIRKKRNGAAFVAPCFPRSLCIGLTLPRYSPGLILRWLFATRLLSHFHTKVECFNPTLLNGIGLLQIIGKMGEIAIEQSSKTRPGRV